MYIRYVNSKISHLTVLISRTGIVKKQERNALWAKCSNFDSTKNLNTAKASGFGS